MQRRPVRRAIVAALTTLILLTVSAYADTAPADGDALLPGNQNLVPLPNASPGQVVTRLVNFRLTCAGVNHAPAGATIQLDFDGATVPGDGLASATSTSIGPVPAGWASNGCDSPAQTLAANAPSTVTLTMPTTAGDGYEFTVSWAYSGATGLTGMTVVTFRVNVVVNTPPTLNLPSDVSAEATSPDGADVTWTATATDHEDATPPTPTCAPASGSTFPLGTTTVHCSVTDDGGLKDAGSFDVRVGDTTDPKLFGMPADQDITTADPTGTTLRYDAPTARDLADASPSVDCAPASGSHIKVGTTDVTCTARDATGNHVSATFSVKVTYVPAVEWSATWGEPVASGGATFLANAGRSVPVKVEIFANGVEQTHGEAKLGLASCGGTAIGSIDLTWDAGRWNGKLDTSMLGGPGCYVATASLDGSVAGSFRVELRAADPAAAKGGAKPKTAP
jgi:hypothetical protein